MEELSDVEYDIVGAWKLYLTERAAPTPDDAVRSLRLQQHF